MATDSRSRPAPRRRLPGGSVPLLVPAALLLAALSGCGGGAGPDDLLLISVDTLRADALGCYGNPAARTPAWDRLARGGVQCASAGSCAPFTLPSHATMLTGVDPYEHLARRNGSRRFDPPVPTLAERLADDGLRCGAAVATAVLEPASGLDRGFEFYDPGGRPAPEERPAPSVVASARQFLESVPTTERFFLFVHFYDPHDPYRPAPPWPRVFPDAPYDGEVAATDREMLRLMRHVESRAPHRPTMVVALADHGEAFGEHGETGHGFFLYESTLRIPFVAQGPGLPVGHVTNVPARTIDVVPTVLSAFGAGDLAELPGRPVQAAPPADVPESYAETFHSALAYGTSDLRSLSRGEWKYVRSPREELYDLAADPGETRNALEESPDVADDLRDRLDDLLGDDLLAPQGLAAESIDPAQAERLRALGYVTDGDWSGAADFRALPDPKDFLGIPELLDEAKIAARDANWDVALAGVDAVLEKDPRNADALRLLARERFERISVEAGLAVYRSALERHPDAAGVWAAYGEDLHRLAREDEAFEALTRAVELDGAAVPARMALARVAVALGRQDEARRQVKEVLTLDPAHSGARAMERRLRDAPSGG